MGVYEYNPPEFLKVDTSDTLKEILAKPVAPYVAPEPVDDDSEFTKGVKRGYEGLKSTAYGAAGLVGSGLGIDSLKDWGYEGFLEHEEAAAKHAGRVQSIEDIKGIGDAADWAAGTFGSLVPSIGEAAVTAAAGGIAGSVVGPEGTIGGAATGLVAKQTVKSMIRKLAKEYVKDGMEKQVAKSAAKDAVESLGAKALYRNIGTKAGIVAGTAPIEAGGMWGEGMQEGKDNPYSAAVFGTLSGLSELLGGEAELIDVFTNPARQAAKGHVIKRIGVELSKTVPQEALQEATQETLSIINRKLVDPSYEMFGEDARSRVLNSAAAGALGGVAFGGAGGVMNGRSEGRGTGNEDNRNLESRTSNREPGLEPDPFTDVGEPPHPVVDLESQENPVLPEAPKGPLARAAEAAGASIIPGIGDVAPAPASGSASVPPIGGLTTDELVLDEARDWAEGEIKAGKTQLMRQVREHPSSYAQRILDSYKRRGETPVVNQEATGPKYAKVSLVNPETGVAEMVTPDEVMDRLKNGWRAPEAPANSSDADMLGRVTDADRGLLQSARERAAYWERGSMDNGRGNKEELFPWLKDWGKTTPAEVSKAIGNFLEGKNLGGVQQQLVTAALQFERENRQPRGAAPAQGIGDLIAERRGVKGGSEERGTRSEDNLEPQTSNLDPAVLKKAQLYAEKAGLDLEGWDDGEISDFVGKYDSFVKSKSRAAAPIASIGDLIAQRRAMSQKGKADIEAGAHEAATSPHNDLAQPTEAQVKAGNYQKGHINVQGLDISIENPAGSVRSGKDPNGKPWSTTIHHHYGYIKGTVGKDKDHIDTFIGDKPEGDRVFVVDQIDPKTGKFDEHKVMIGFDSQDEATLEYLHNYDDSGQTRIGAVTEMSMDDFKTWLKSGKTKTPVGQLKKVAESQGKGKPGVQPANDAREKIVAKLKAGGADEGIAGQIADLIAEEYAGKKALGPAWLGKRIKEGWVEKWKLQAQLKSGERLPEDLTPEEIATLPVAKKADRPVNSALKAVMKGEERDSQQGKKKEEKTEVGEGQGTVDSEQRTGDKNKKEPTLSSDGITPLRENRDPSMILNTLESAWDTQMQRFDMIMSDPENREVWKRVPSKAAAKKYITEQVTAGEGGTVQDFLSDLSQMEDAKYAKYGSLSASEGKPAESTLPASYGDKNSVFTKDKAERAREILRKKLSQLNAGLDPEMIQAGIDLAGYHIEAGARSFAEYSKRMVADLGEAISPFLKAFYLAVRNYPGFDNAGMDTEAQIESGEAVKKVAKATAVKKVAGRGDRSLLGDYGVENLDAYTDAGSNAKDAFLKDAKGFLQDVGKVLADNGWTPEKVSVNAAGIAMSGDVSLIAFKDGMEHGVYVTIGGGMRLPGSSESPSGVRIMYRANTRKDKYVGKVNRWDAPWDATSGELAGMLMAEAERYEGTSASQSQPVDEKSTGLYISEKQITNPAKNIVKLLQGLGLMDKVLQGEDFHTRLNNGPYIPLVIERHNDGKNGDPQLYFTHYLERGGDLVLDSEMVWRVSPRGMLVLAESAVPDSRTGGENRLRDDKADSGYAAMFARNLIEQGWETAKVEEKSGLQDSQESDKIFNENRFNTAEEGGVTNDGSESGSAEEQSDVRGMGAEGVGQTGRRDAGNGRTGSGEDAEVLETVPAADVAASDSDGDREGAGSRPRREVRRGDSEKPEGGNGSDGRTGTGRAGLAADGTGGSGDRRGDGARASVSVGDEPNLTRVNYHISDPEKLVGGTPKVRFAKNRAAIEALQSITSEGRTPTPEELDAMAAYTGWGSFGQELFQGNWDNPRPKSEWEKESQWLRDHLGEKNWKSAQNSIINAHYTDPPTVAAMWDLATKLGFKGGRILEPSIGIGNFFGLMPRNIMERSKLAGIELDTLTGGMAQILYPQANIQIKGYQESKTSDNFYDLIIGNWPFAKDGPADRRYRQISPSLHDYFFLKAMDQVRPGGLVIGVTSSGTMDKIGKLTRMELAKKGDLVAAFRLPSGAFKQYAGTEVVTDILILKKRENPNTDIAGSGWMETVDHATANGDIKINEYWKDHPDHVFGELDFASGGPRGRGGMTVNRPSNYADRLARIADMIPEGVYDARSETKKIISYITNNTTDRQQSVTISDDGGLYVVQGEYLAPLKELVSYVVKSEKETRARENQISALVKIRKAYGALIDAERSGEPADALRKELATQYDTFVKKYGRINESIGLTFIRKAGDPFYATLAALEVTEKTAKGTVYRPAKILSESTVRSTRTITNPSVQDAYVLARNESLNIDLNRVAELSGKPLEDVTRELLNSGSIFLTPAGNHEVSDQYLSGNVRRKLREAEAAQADGMEMSRNIEELKKIVPPDQPYYKIEAKLGAPWVSPDHYKRFIADMLGEPGESGIDVAFQLGAWKVKFTRDGLNGKPEATTVWGHPSYRFNKLVQAAMNNSAVTIWGRDEDGNKVVDSIATAEANEKAGRIREEFSSWVWKDSARKIALEKEYNEVMNAIADTKYDGSFLNFEGMALTRGSSPFNLRKHQVDAIWRGLVNRGGLYAHEVGTGKTYTMGGIAVESRRYGIARKPLIFAHNANSATVAREIQEMYPAAKVLYVDNLTPDKIDVTMRQIANDDWDAVVVPHSLISRFGLTRETLNELAAEEISALEQEAIEAAQEDGVELSVGDMDDEEAMKKVRSVTAKSLVHSRNRIIKKIDEMAMRASRENAVSFEQLGVDMVMVDEVHEFKKPPITTKMRMRGLNTATSDQSLALHLLTGYVKRINSGGGVHIFTGTPITNTLTEIYHMMRYVMDGEMERSGIKAWDSWFNTFADSSSDVELTAAGDYEAVTRLASFVNVPELRRMMGQYTDIVFADDMPEFKPREVNGKTLQDKSLTDKERDSLVNGRSEDPVGRPYKKIVVETCPMGSQQRVILEELARLAKHFRQASPKERREIMLSGHPASPVLVETAAANAGMDVRLVNKDAYDDPESKVNRCVGNLLKIYKEHDKTTQVLFMERGFSDKSTSTKTNRDGTKTKTTKERFNLSKDIVDKLVAGGIPREQIAIIDGKVSKEKRKQTADAMNRGDIRVVIGNTKTLGVGVNMQENLRAIHHLDAPWMPGELEQRNGRGHRQGNKWNTVLEIRYVTEKLDGRRWQVLVIKDRFIKAFLKAKDDVRVIDGDAVNMDESDNVSDLSQTLSEAAGDPRILLREKYKKDIEKLQNRERMHAYGIEDAEEAANKSEKRIADSKRRRGIIEKMVERYESARETFSASIGKETFTDRAKAQEALDARLEKMGRFSDKEKIGEIYGFDIVGRWSQMFEKYEISLTMPAAWPEGKYKSREWADEQDRNYIENFLEAKPSVASMEAILRNLKKHNESAKEKEASLAESIKTLREAAKETFPRAAELEKKKQMLADLMDDLEGNPVPPPSWLRHGAPEGGEVYVKGKLYPVTGHKWTNDGYFVTVDKGSSTENVPYMEVTDENGSPVYEERDFESPSVSSSARSTGQGQAHYSMGDMAASFGLPAADIKTAFEPVYKNMPNSPPWRVVQTTADLPKRALDDAAKRGIPQRLLQAVYLGNEVVYVADNFRSVEEAKQVLLEEVVVHHGLRGILAKDAYEKHMLQAALWYANKRNAEWKELAARYGLDLKTRDGRIEAAEEMLGRDARTGMDSSILSKVIAAVKEFLRSVGLDFGYGDAEIRELLGKARRFVEGKEQGAAGREQGTGIDYGAMLRSLREQGITDDQLEAFANWQPGGARYAAAWHGSPHDHDGFTTQKIGSGEGAQAYGWGLYFAGRREVAEFYKKALSGRPSYLYGGKVYTGNLNDPYYSAVNNVVKNGKNDAVGYFETMAKYEENPTMRTMYETLLDFVKDIDASAIKQIDNKGKLYHVELAPQEDEYLDWDKPLSKQSKKVKEAMKSGERFVKPILEYFNREGVDPTGKQIYEELSAGDKKWGSEQLHSLGIRGIKYLDALSRKNESKVTRIWENEKKPDLPQWRVSGQDGYNQSFKTEDEAIRDAENRNANNRHHNYVIFDDSDVSITAKFALARLEDVKGQIVDKGVSLNTTEREVLEADKAKAIEAIETTVRDYDEPGRLLFRAFYAADQQHSPGVVPFNPDRGHFAAGEDLKGSWWTTSYSTAQEIAWSKGRDGRTVKIVALPVDKLPSGKVFIQNTNPPGFVYDLFVGLPADVPLRDVQEMPVDTGIRYALADRFTGYVGEMKGGDVWKRIARMLNPFDWSRLKRVIGDITPQSIINGVASFLRNPIFEAEADENKKPFVENGVKREQTKLDYLLRFLGWDGQSADNPNIMERLKKTYSQWESGDRTTAWGRIADGYQKLSAADRKAVDWLLYQGDLQGRVFRDLETVKKDPRASKGKPTEASFAVYQQVRTHIDTVVAKTVEDLSRQFMLDAGLPDQVIEKHLSDYRNQLAERPGWLPRNHGEGDYQVNVYHVITGLRWQTRSDKDSMQALLPYYPSKEVADEIKRLAARLGLKYQHLPSGGQLVSTYKNATAVFKKKIDKLQAKINAATGDEKVKLQTELGELEHAKMMAETMPDVQINRFWKKANEIIPNLQTKNKVAIHERKQALEQAIEDGESESTINMLKDELKKFGDGRIRVKVYMRLKETKTRAEQHKAEVEKDLKKFIPGNYLDWAKYEVEEPRFSDQISEDMYGDMKNDFAMEQGQLAAINKAAAHQEISKKEAAALRQTILQSTAEVLMARGAGAHRIRRAEYLIEGYDAENTIDAYHDYMTGTSGMLSKARYAQEQFEQFRYAKPEVKRWAHRYIVDNLRNMGFADRVSGNMRALASFAYLGFKVSSMIINATQPWTLGIAELGRHTKRSAVWAIGKAQKDIVTGKLSESEKRLFASEIFKLQEMETAVHEMSGQREGVTGKVSRFMHTLTDKALMPFQEVELLNRKTVILAAYRTFRADGISRNDALKKALEVNRSVNFEMSRANLPGFAQKPLGRTVYALQSFMWNNWNWVYNRMTSGEKEDMKALLRYAVAMGIIGGAMALPGGDELDKLYQMLFGESPKLGLQKWTAKHAKEYGTLGEMVNGFAWHGAASAAGINISNAIRLQIPIVSPLIGGESLPEAAGGVFTGLLQKGGRAAVAASRGDIYRTVENLSPEALAGAMRAYRMSTRGATTSSGKILFDEDGKQMKYSGAEALTRTLGFQPSRVSERSDLTNIEYGLMGHWKEERGDLLAKLRIAKGDERKEVMRKIMKFNRDLRTSQAAGLVPIIKAQTIKQALASKPNKRKMEWEKNQLID